LSDRITNYNFENATLQARAKEQKGREKEERARLKAEEMEQKTVKEASTKKKEEAAKKPARRTAVAMMDHNGSRVDVLSQCQSRSVTPDQGRGSPADDMDDDAETYTEVEEEDAIGLGEKEIEEDAIGSDDTEFRGGASIPTEVPDTPKRTDMLYLQI